MNKEQQALNTLKQKGYTNHFQPIKLEYQYPNEFKTLQELVDQQSILEEYNVTPEILREVLLTGQMFRNKPTLSECIKEWEDRGFEDIKNNKKSFSARNTRLNVDVYIDKRSKNIQISTCHYNYTQTISFDLHNLIHKTIKALEAEE